jgi:hypothetical protein
VSVLSKNSSVPTVLVAGGLAPRHWLENQQLCAVIDQSPLGQLVAEFCASANCIQTNQQNAAVDQGPVPRNLPHELWLARQSGFDRFGELAAQTVIEDWPQYFDECELDTRNQFNWWRIDPVYCHLATDHIVLGRATIDDLRLAEAQELAAALADYCASLGFSIHVPHPQRWYLKWHVPSRPALLDTASALAAQGRSIELYLPQNRSLPQKNTARDCTDDNAHDYARDWRRLVGEAEVSWFNHPVNTARQTRGQLSINSLWLVGPCPPKQAINKQDSGFANQHLLFIEPIEELVNERAYEWATSVAKISDEQLDPIRQQLQAKQKCTLMLTSDHESLAFELLAHTSIGRWKRRLGWSKSPTLLSLICAQNVATATEQ